MSHTHRPGGPACIHPTKKACEDAFVQWQADEQVRLARIIVAGGRAGAFRRDRGVFAQLVSVLAGDRADIMTQEGNPNVSPFVVRLRRSYTGSEPATAGE